MTYSDLKKIQKYSSQERESNLFSNFILFFWKYLMTTIATKPQLGVEQYALKILNIFRDGIRSHFQVIVNGQVNYGKKVLL